MINPLVDAYATEHNVQNEPLSSSSAKRDSAERNLAADPRLRRGASLKASAPRPQLPIAA